MFYTDINVEGNGKDMGVSQVEALKPIPCTVWRKIYIFFSNCYITLDLTYFISSQFRITPLLRLFRLVVSVCWGSHRAILLF